MIGLHAHHYITLHLKDAFIQNDLQRGTYPAAE